jgi:hypothetical protein
VKRIPNELMNLFRSKPAQKTARDQTRIARARWAEISLKMHARSERERVAEPSTALRITERF